MNPPNTYNPHLQQEQQQQQYSTQYQQQQEQKEHQQQPNDNNNSLTRQQQEEYSHKLTSDFEFLNNRSPFYQTLSRHCVMPIMCKQLINFQFNLPSHYVNDISHKNIHRLLHIRLFDLVSLKHCAWNDNTFSLKINNISIKLPKNKQEKEKHSNNNIHKYIPALDISSYVSHTMIFEITCFKHIFSGAASIEVVNRLNINFLINKIQNKTQLSDALHANNGNNGNNNDNKCYICANNNNLSRCSRCKAIWYCSRNHQSIDWNRHNIGCFPYTKLVKLKLKYKYDNDCKNNNDNDIICSGIRISLRDPLSLSRIKLPIRGINCAHLQCIDLNTYLLYCSNTRIWQCPICMKSLKYCDILIDNRMQNIITKIEKQKLDIDQITLNADDYSYNIINTNNCNNKRKINQITDTDLDDNNPNKKRRKNSYKVIILD